VPEAGIVRVIEGASAWKGSSLKKRSFAGGSKTLRVESIVRDRVR